MPFAALVCAEVAQIEVAVSGAIRAGLVTSSDIGRGRIGTIIDAVRQQPIRPNAALIFDGLPARFRTDFDQGNSGHGSISFCCSQKDKRRNCGKPITRIEK
jgi:hypothetical protein